MDLKGITLSQINQTEKVNAVCSHLYLESKNNNNKTKTQLIEKVIRFVVTRGG